MSNTISSFPSSQSLKSTNIQQYVGKSAKFLVSSTAGWIILTSSKSYISIYYVFLAVLNAISSKLLKHILKQPRPTVHQRSHNESTGNFIKENGYGMPSSHTQSLFYFYMILSLRIKDINIYTIVYWFVLTLYTFHTR